MGMKPASDPVEEPEDDEENEEDLEVSSEPLEATGANRPSSPPPAKPQFSALNHGTRPAPTVDLDDHTAQQDVPSFNDQDEPDALGLPCEVL